MMGKAIEEEERTCMRMELWRQSMAVVGDDMLAMPERGRFPVGLQDRANWFLAIPMLFFRTPCNTNVWR
jgi:hypothetical protein